MKEIEIRRHKFLINTTEYDVEWAACEFGAQVGGITDTEVREALLETGVLYSETSPPHIYVSQALSYEHQALSALHEELCMRRKIASCPDVEEIVIDSIDDDTSRESFIQNRLRMFGALCILNPENASFETAAERLRTRLHYLRTQSNT